MFILFDVGGTKIRVGIARDNGGIADSVIVPTPAGYDEGLIAIRDAARSLGAEKNITAVVGGIAGAFDRDHETLVGAINIKQWEQKPVKRDLQELFKAPVVLENDAALAGLGEAVAGAGKDYDIVAYITVSTGMGGARITKKTIDAHVFGFEPGFQIIDADGSSCGTCRHRHLGVHISGRGIETHYGRKGEEINDPVVWEDVTRQLSVGLLNTIYHWSPEILILGGSVMQRISLDRLREAMKERVRVYPELPVIERAALGELGGLEGALHIARNLDNL